MYKLTIFTLVIATVAALPRSLRKVPGGGRIVGGEDATPGQFPHQLSLIWFGSHICGASIIGEHLAITAAHCVDGDAPSSLRVLAGKHRRTVTGPNEQPRNVERVLVHEDYDSGSFANDIALLWLDSTHPFVFDDFVSPATLPRLNEETTGDIIVSGWGTTASGGQLADILQWVQIPSVTDAQCQEWYSNENILPSMLCAGLEMGGKDSCQGDSGGPLIDVGTRNLVGLVSWGYGCAAPRAPGVNTQISHFIDWITANSP